MQVLRRVSLSFVVRLQLALRLAGAPLGRLELGAQPLRLGELPPLGELRALEPRLQLAALPLRLARRLRLGQGAEGGCGPGGGGALRRGAGWRGAREGGGQV